MDDIATAEVFVPFSVDQWNPMRESWIAYHARMMEVLDDFLEEQRKRGT